MRKSFTHLAQHELDSVIIIIIIIIIVAVIIVLLHVRKESTHQMLRPAVGLLLHRTLAGVPWRGVGQGDWARGPFCPSLGAQKHLC